MVSKHLKILKQPEPSLEGVLPEGLELRLNSSLVILVGENGSGKTAFLRMLGSSLENSHFFDEEGISRYVELDPKYWENQNVFLKEDSLDVNLLSGNRLIGNPFCSNPSGLGSRTLEFITYHNYDEDFPEISFQEGTAEVDNQWVNVNTDYLPGNILLNLEEDIENLVISPTETLKKFKEIFPDLDFNPERDIKTIEYKKRFLKEGTHITIDPCYDPYRNSKKKINVYELYLTGQIEKVEVIDKNKFRQIRKTLISKLTQDCPSLRYQLIDLNLNAPERIKSLIALPKTVDYERSFSGADRPLINSNKRQIRRRMDPKEVRHRDYDGFYSWEKGLASILYFQFSSKKDETSRWYKGPEKSQGQDLRIHLEKQLFSGIEDFFERGIIKKEEFEVSEEVNPNNSSLIVLCDEPSIFLSYQNKYWFRDEVSRMLERYSGRLQFFIATNDPILIEKSQGAQYINFNYQPAQPQKEFH